MIGNNSLSERFIGYALVLALAGLVWIALISPLSSWRSDSLLQHEAATREHSKMLTSTRRLQSEVEFFSQSGSQAYIWQAEQSGEATAKIQSELNNLATKSGITLRSISPAAAKQLPFTTGTTFRLEGEATLDQILSFVLSIEFNEPALLTERASLRRLIRPGRTSEQPLMFFQLDIIAPVLIGNMQ